MRLEPELNSDGDLIRIGQSAAGGLACEPTEASVLDTQAQRVRHVVAQPEAIIHAIALPSRIARYKRCAGEQSPRVVLRISEPSIKRQAANDLPARVHVGVPRARTCIAQRQTCPGTNDRCLSTLTQGILVCSIDGCFDSDFVLPPIAAEEECALRRVVRNRRCETVPGERCISELESLRLGAVVAQRDAAVEAVLGERSGGGAKRNQRPQANHK